VRAEAPIPHEHAHDDDGRLPRGTPHQGRVSENLHPRFPGRGAGLEQKLSQNQPGGFPAGQQTAGKGVLQPAAAAARASAIRRQASDLVFGTNCDVPEPDGVPVLYAEVPAAAAAPLLPHPIPRRYLTCHRPGQQTGLAGHDPEKLGGRSFPRPLVQAQHFEPGTDQHHRLLVHGHQKHGHAGG